MIENQSRMLRKKAVSRFFGFLERIKKLLRWGL